MEQRIINEIIELAGADNCREQEPMDRHVTFRIGGPARLFVAPREPETLRDVLRYCRRENVKTFVMGNGSNLLVSDEGFDGVVVQVSHNLSGIAREGNGFRVGAGALLSAVAAEALREGLTGFEFAAGIPGTVGGAAIMNAGAYGGEIGDVLSEVTVLDDRLELVTLKRDQLEFGYRSSSLARKGMIVVSAVVTLSEGDRDEIKGRMDELREQRRSKQPLEYPSAGSTFKRPVGDFAGRLIMEAGFRGYRVGGAGVSEKHCGFVVNLGGATARDVIQLTDQVKEKVWKEFGVSLELEIKLLGEFG